MQPVRDGTGGGAGYWRLGAHLRGCHSHAAACHAPLALLGRLGCLGRCCRRRRPGRGAAADGGGAAVELPVARGARPGWPPIQPDSHGQAARRGLVLLRCRPFTRPAHAPHSPFTRPSHALRTPITRPAPRRTAPCSPLQPLAAAASLSAHACSPTNAACSLPVLHVCIPVCCRPAPCAAACNPVCCMPATPCAACLHPPVLHACSPMSMSMCCRPHGAGWVGRGSLRG